MISSCLHFGHSWVTRMRADPSTSLRRRRLDAHHGIAAAHPLFFVERRRKRDHVAPARPAELAVRRGGFPIESTGARAVGADRIGFGHPGAQGIAPEDHLELALR